MTNLQAGGHARQSDPADHPPPAFVPWNESQFQLLGNGHTLKHYLDFLEKTAFRGVEVSTKVTEFFQSLERQMGDHPSLNDKMQAKPLANTNEAHVTPNPILAGAANPNEPSLTSKPSNISSSQLGRYLAANNIGRYTSYQHRTRDGLKLPHKPFHPHYCRLLEYMCYIIEETNTEKLHDMVKDFEKELLESHQYQMIVTESPLPYLECTNERVRISVKTGKHCKMCYRNQPGNLTAKMKEQLCKQSRMGCAACKENICKYCWDKGYDRHVFH